MMGFFLFLQFLFLPQVKETPEYTLKAKIQAVCPDVTPEILTMMDEEISGYRGTVSEDIAVAVARVETNCTHPRKVGGHGEWGMLQVIPYDRHIVSIMDGHSCEEGYAETVVSQGVRTPVCSGGKLNIRVRGVISPARVFSILKGSPRIALRVGLLELRYWKAGYEADYRRRFWSRKNVVVNGKTWWYRTVVSSLGDDVWVSHHNWGPRFIPGNWYPLRIAAEVRKIGGGK